jgi:hypothetical protein
MSSPSRDEHIGALTRSGVQDSLLARHRAFWSLDDTDRPLLTIPPRVDWPPLEIPVASGTHLADEGYLTPELLDPERYFIQMATRWDPLGPVEGDQFRIMTAYWLVPWLEAICGCRVRYFRDSGTMYPEAPQGDWDHVLALRPRRDDPWLATLREFYVVMRDLCADRYPLGVVMPMRGPIDMLGALVGVEQMCLAFADKPSMVSEALSILTDIWIEAVQEQVALVPPFADGMASCEHYGLWVPGTNAVSQCDLVVAISSRTYARFLLPCDERISASLDYPIMHLHSAGLHVLEPIVSLSSLAAVQVVIDPTPPANSIADLVPHFLGVQAAGKPLIIHAGEVTQAELDCLLDALTPSGLCVRCSIRGYSSQSASGS